MPASVVTGSARSARASALRPRVVLPLGAACAALLTAGLPSAADPVDEPDAGQDDPGADPVSQSAPAGSNSSAIRELSIENVSDFVAVRVRHAGRYWDGRTDVKLAVDDDASYPYRLSVRRTDDRAVLSRSNGRSWNCSGVQANANDASTETLVVVPRSCFESSAEKVRAKASSYSDGAKTSSASRSNVGRTDKPNVVVIMSDDMRDDELDGPWMKQTRRWIGDAGVRFSNSFAPLPLCAPARASFLTGQYPHNHGVWSHKPPYGFSVFRDQETLPVWLDRGGYNTFMIGKYINGYGKPNMPAPDGKPSEGYVPPGWDDWRASLDNRGTYHYRRTHLNNNGRVESLVGQYQTNAYRKIATREIKERVKADKPYFMYLSFTAPHLGKPNEDDDPDAAIDLDGREYKIRTPAVPGKVRGRWDDYIPLAPGTGGEADLSDKPDFLQLPGMTRSEQDGVRELARQRAESEGVLDQAVDRIMQQLRDEGQLDNTYVVFTSDNGYFLGEHRMRQGKTLPYEPALRTPTLIRGPGIPAGEQRSDPFLSLDFAPTILRMAGLSTDQKAPIDGRSMLDVAVGSDRGWTRPVITETGPSTVPTLMDLSGETVGEDPNESSNKNRVRGVRAPGFLFTETSGREPELYDLMSDPGEVRSVVEDDNYAKVHSSLDRVLGDLQACLGEECRTPLPDELRGDPGPDSRDEGNADSDGESDGQSKSDGDGDAKSDGDGKSKSDGDGDAKSDGDGDAKSDGDGDAKSDDKTSSGGDDKR